MENTVRIRLQIEALSPLTFGTRRGTTGNFVDTLDYVPGSALRGAAAARYLHEFGDANEPRFQDVFLRGGVLFSNLYPVSGPDVAMSYALPATAYACKAHKEKHGVSDILTRAAALQIGGDNFDSGLLGGITTCKQCGHPSHRLPGLYEKRSDVPRYNLTEVHQRHLTHVGINRQRQAAEKGFLYAQQVINESRREADGDPFFPQIFSGELIVSKDQTAFVKSELLVEAAALRVGESRTRGLGKIQIRKCEILETDSESMIRTRLIEFNRRFAEQLRSPGRYVAVTLQSDAILIDALMRPMSSLHAEHIRRAIGHHPHASQITPETVQLVYSNASARLLQTWNVASGYPKPDELGTVMGSVFLFRIAEDLWQAPSETEGTEADTLAHLLKDLQQHGLGTRRSEGFGRVTVCDPFHWEVDELWQAI